MEDIILVGLGGHAKSVIDTIDRERKYRIVGILEAAEYQDRTYQGYHVIGTDDDMEAFYANGLRNAFVSIGYMGRSDARNRIYWRLKQAGFSLPVIQDPSAIVSGNAEIGEGTFIGKNVVVNADAYVGKMCILNTGAVIEHESRIGEFSHIAVGAVVCGQVDVGYGTFIGAGTTVIQGIKIGSQSVIGAGTVVVKNIPDKTMVYGKILKEIRTGE